MSAALKPSADKPVAIWSFEAITCATAGTDSQRPRRMPRDARTCMSDSIARSLATAMDRPSGSKLACATQLAICASARGARVRGRRPLFQLRSAAVLLSAVPQGPGQRCPLGPSPVHCHRAATPRRFSALAWRRCTCRCTCKRLRQQLWVTHTHGSSRHSASALTPPVQSAQAGASDAP